ncbi:hypothetical protein [Aerococcus urinae]|uniref:Uncharacterized protein n=1 Tax=Aerococcus urinae TaxID=1376 RepID=A0ABT4C530_9LACT|nr:hypothetical protein [Aerococcus urinae]MCY3032932.1 hypothetical protein [Aerococcus urinae]MCY3038076.1 hypothetical protein [Aerococcus urinae]MCY3044978.1 hypothetical protein [Aerococcus urinae]MCY3046137.1 hypothetical protein [Aerococcus urinae]MCY3048432.1 hypothetical protein [Aerococcus urinae]
MDILSNFSNQSDIFTPSHEEVMSLSEDLLKRNKEVYEELAK